MTVFLSDTDANLYQLGGQGLYILRYKYIWNEQSMQIYTWQFLVISSLG